jgi:hypothetical protein
MSWIDSCREKCKTIKYLGSEMVWEERPQRSGALRVQIPLLNKNRVTIPGLMLQGDFYVKKKTGHEVVTYGLLARYGPEWRRVFFYCIWPDHVRSHRDDENGVMFGPHLHLGDGRIEQTVRKLVTGIASPLDPKWLMRYQRHTNLRANGNHELTAPIKDDLFGG